MKAALGGEAIWVREANPSRSAHFWNNVIPFDEPILQNRRLPPENGMELRGADIGAVEIYLCFFRLLVGLGSVL
jgi:hypothetical protein